MAHTILLLRLSGVALIILGIWQFIMSKKYIKYINNKGTNNTFSPMAMYSGMILGIFAFIVGLFMIFGANGIYASFFRS